MGWFDSESSEDKMYKALEGFEIHTSDATIQRKITKSEFVKHVNLNTYDLVRELVDRCKRSGYNGIVGFKFTQSAGLAGAAGIIGYGTAVKFE